MFKTKLSLKAKLIATFLLIGLIPSALISLNAEIGLHTLREVFPKQYEGIARSLTDTIDRNLFERYGDVQAFGYNTVVQDSSYWYKKGIADNPIVDVMNKYMLAYGLYDLALLVDLDGKVIAVNDQDYRGKSINSEYLYDKNFAEHSWFKDVINGSFYTAGAGSLTGTVMEDVYVDEDVAKIYGNEGLVIGYAAPVFDNAGKTIAVWKNFAQFGLVEAIVKDFYANQAEQGYDQVEVTILNKKGLLLLNYDPYTSGSREISRDMKLIGKSNLAQQGNELAKQALTKEAGTANAWNDKKQLNQIVGFAQHRGALGFKGMPWVVLVQNSEAAVLGFLEKLETREIIISLACAIAIVFFGWLIVRGIANPIDLILKELRSNSGELRSASAQVASSAQALAQGATQQAASLEESAATLEEVSSAVKHSSDNSQSALGIAEQVRTASEKGSSSMHQMTSAMTNIKTAADETAQIIKIIDEIAFQTNLLALNAAVEAARAGDAGKGFAVVAEEVRNLAQRSATAARETSDKIKRSKDLAENGVKVTMDTATSLGEINQNSIKSTDLVKEIAAQSREQATAMTQLTTAVSELDKVTQQNSAAAEQSSAAAEQLTAQANTLDEVIGRLANVIYGRSKVDQAVSANKSQVAGSANPSRVASNLKQSPHKANYSDNGKAKRNGMIELSASQIIPLDDGDFKGF